MLIPKALSDDSRIRILLALDKGELCVCQITELLGLAPSTVSKHLSILHQARLIEARKDKRWVYYSMPKDAPAEALKAIAWVKESLKDNIQIREDIKLLKGILKKGIKGIC